MVFFGDVLQARKIPADPEQVIFYPSYGYQQGDEWAIPMRVYVFEDRPVAESFVAQIVSARRDVTEREMERFRYRMKDFVADSESREIPAFIFEDDPDQEIFHLLNSEGEPIRTNLNGLASAEVRISADKVEKILNNSESEDGWQRIISANEEHAGGGWIRFLDAEGLSIISDIDDTIKITEIPVGSSVVLENTFFKPFEAVPGMAERYREYGSGAAVHYVSGSPWQLFRPLSEFLWSGEAGFPKGSFHMKTVTKNLFSLSTWSSLRDLLFNEDFTFEQKREQMAVIIRQFPQRKFILFGDSGESDPEVFADLKQEFGDQIIEMMIRDVRNIRMENPERLEGMNIIPVQ